MISNNNGTNHANELNEFFINNISSTFSFLSRARGLFTLKERMQGKKNTAIKENECVALDYNESNEGVCLQNMSNNPIELRLGREEAFLIGEEFGIRIGKQICEAFDENAKNIIKIPQYVEGVTISFIEGILKSLPDGIARKDFYKYFSIEGRVDIVNKFNEVIMVCV